MYSEKATNFCDISTIDLSDVVTGKSTVEISQNFVAFSEYMKFTVKSFSGQMELILCHFSIKVLYWSPNFVVNGRDFLNILHFSFALCKAADVATVEERIDK